MISADANHAPKSKTALESAVFYGANCGITAYQQVTAETVQGRGWKKVVYKKSYMLLFCRSLVVEGSQIGPEISGVSGVRFRFEPLGMFTNTTDGHVSGIHIPLTDKTLQSKTFALASGRNGRGSCGTAGHIRALWVAICR